MNPGDRVQVKLMHGPRRYAGAFGTIVSPGNRNNIFVVLFDDDSLNQNGPTGMDVHIELLVPVWELVIQEMTL